MPIKLNGSSSGYTQIEAASVAGNNTLTLPTASGTLMTTGGTNTFTANQVIEVTDNTNAALRVTQLGTGDAIRIEDSTNPDSTPFIIDAAGNIIQGDTAVPSAAWPLIGQKSTLAGGPSFVQTNSVADVNGSNVRFQKDRAGAVVASGDALGRILWYGYDGAAYINAASIQAVVDTTPGTNDMPGRLMFFTTADGASTLTERMRIDSSGNVGIGTASPNAKLETRNATAGAEVSRFEGNYSASGSVVLTNWRRSGGAVAAIMRYSDATTTMDFGTTTSHAQTFITGGTERMRIDSNGKVLVGTSSTFIGASNLQIASSLNEQIAIRSTAAAAGRCWRFTADSNNTTYIANQDSVGVYIGNGNSSWSSLSDERTKDIIEPITDAANKVSRLRAVIGKYKTDEEGKRRSFLIAQDVQAVLPEAVSVANAETGHLGLSYTDTIPLLTAALQEALTKIDALEARIAALENA